VPVRSRSEEYAGHPSSLQIYLQKFGESAIITPIETWKVFIAWAIDHEAVRRRIWHSLQPRLQEQPPGVGRSLLVHLSSIITMRVVAVT
jgi:hypothetical protein